MCGRPLCCAAFLKDFASINVKMAKEQDLSLTPSTISGICGRLKCCLKYEHEGYLELEAGMPRRGDCCECKEGRGRIIDRNLLTQKVVVQLDDTNRTVTCPKEEVTVIYPEKYKIQKKDRNEGGNNNRDRNNNHNGKHPQPPKNNNGGNHRSQSAATQKDGPRASPAAPVKPALFFGGRSGGCARKSIFSRPRKKREPERRKGALRRDRLFAWRLLPGSVHFEDHIPIDCTVSQ